MNKLLILPIITIILLIGCGEGKQNNSNTNQSNQSKDAKKEEKQPPVNAAISQIPEAPTKTYDGPLGLAMGIGIDELLGKIASAKTLESNPNIYAITPPKSAPG